MKKNSEHTKKVIRLFKWFLKVHGVADEYKLLLCRYNAQCRRRHGNMRRQICASSCGLLGNAFPFYDRKWYPLHEKWVEICHAFNL